MPGWQSFYEQHRSENFELVSIAIDVQGPDKARPWVEKAKASYPTLVDRTGVLPAHFRVNYIPFTVLIDEEGRVVRGPKLAKVNDDRQRAEILAWIEKGPAAVAFPKEGKPSKMSGFTSPEAELRFQLAATLLASGQPETALPYLKAAVKYEPRNWIIRKQIWAIEHPDRFYDGPVDFGWQRDKLKQERAKNE